MPTVTRREFVRLASFGGGAALFALASAPRTALAAGAADILLLSCMDYRLVDETEAYMAGRGLRDKYDHVILAGASLGALTDKYPAWNQTFWLHLDVAIQLHGVHTVMVMDHRDCGAYKTILGEDLAPTRDRETAVHGDRLKELRRQIKAKHAALDVELLLMDLDGKVQAIA